MAYKIKTDIRRKILDVTRELLINKGITQVSIRLIAKQVECSVGTIYFYFKDKDELVHALIEEGFEKLIELQEKTESQYPEPIERLKALCKNYINFALENPEYYEIMFMLKQERMARYPAEKYRRARKSLDIISNTLNLYAEKEKINVGDTFLAAHLIWTFMHGLVTLLQAKRIDHSIDEQKIIDSIIKHIINMNFKNNE